MGDFSDALDVFRAKQHIWEARNGAATLLRDARPDTVVTVAGVLDGDPSLRAALTLEPCLAYRVRCGVRRDDFKMTQFFVTAGARLPFVVVDAQGERVRVDLGDGDDDMLVGASFSDVTSSARVSADNDVLAALIGRKHAARAIDLARRHVGAFFEDRFLPGEPVIVRGVLEETDEIVATGYRDAVRRGFRLKTGAEQRLILCRPEAPE